MKEEKVQTMKNKPTLSLKNLKNINIVKNLKHWIIAPCIVFLLAIIVFASFAGIAQDVSEGMNIGLDFTGGSSISVQFAELADNDYDGCVKTVSDIIKSKGLRVGYVQKTSEDGISGIMFRYKSADTEEAKAVNDEIIAEIKAAYPNESETNENFISSQFIGATASQTLINQAFLAVGVACLIMLIYIVIRFEIWSGLAAVIALLHDVIIILALTIIFHIQVNTTIIAAVVTIVGYSINNTIIVFDRVRENVKENKIKNIGEQVKLFDIVDKSVKETLSRTINTTITTLIAVIALAIFGVSSIQEFIIPILFGLFAGTYSSVLLAPSLYAYMKNAYDKSRNKKFKGKSGKQIADKKDKKETASA